MEYRGGLMNRYQEAIDIQDACNPVAVAGVLQKQMVSVLRERQSTAAIREDAAVRLLLYKLMDMFYEHPEPGDFSVAYQRCQQEAAEEKKREETDEHPVGPIAAAGD